MVKIKWAKNAGSLKLCQAHGKILINVSCFVDPIIMIINFNGLCKICITLKEEGEEKKWWEREGRQGDKWKEEEGIYIRLNSWEDLHLSCLKRLFRIVPLLSKVDWSRYIKLVLISFVSIHFLAVSNRRSFRLEGSVRRHGVPGIKMKD